MPVVAVSNVAAQDEDTSLDDIIEAGVITVGIEAGYPPFEARDPVTDEIIGFDPDIMGYIAADIGVDIEWVDVAWATIFTSLASGMFDCVISAVTITEEREKTMDFSRWYFKSEQAVMVIVANPKGIDTIADIDSADVNVGVQEGTTSDLYLMDNNITAVKSSFTAVTLAIEALSLGTVDVVLGDKDTLVAGMTNFPGEFEIVDTFSPEDFGIPVQTGFDSLRLKINSIIEELLGADPDNPVVSEFYNTTYQTWMGVEPTFVGKASAIPGFSLLPLAALVSVVSALLVRKIRK
ncbi:MAG: transporter substrate-binding domain-containing protein [Promethearchaeota archaeon]